MRGAFERLAKSVLNRLGQDAFLVSGASTTPCRANVEHGVQVAGAYDDAVFGVHGLFTSAVFTISLGSTGYLLWRLHQQEGWGKALRYVWSFYVV